MPYPAPLLTLFDELGVEEGTSPRFSFNAGSPTVTRTWKTLETEFGEAMLLLNGDVKLPVPLNGKFERWNPHKCPRFRPVDRTFDLFNETKSFFCSGTPSVTGLKWMSETDDGVVPAPTPPDVRKDISNVFKYHHIEAQYERPVYSVLEEADITWEYERYCSEGEARLTADYITMPGGIIVYRRPASLTLPNDRTIPFNVGRVFPTMEIPITWHRVPQDWYSQGTKLWERFYGTSTVRSYVGTVNSKELFGRPPGTMLLSGVEPRRRISPTGRIEWDLTLMFGFDPHGWNFKYFWDTTSAGLSGFYLALQKGVTYPAAPIYDNLVDDTALYNAKDHRLLFWVADEGAVPAPP